MESSLSIEALWILVCAGLMLLIQRGFRVLDHGYAGVHRDHSAEAVTSAVMQREATTVALRDAEEKYKGIFENAIEGIFQTTPDGAYVSANPALARIYGYDDPSQLIEQIGDIERQLYVDPRRRTEFAERIARDGTVTDFESQVYRRDGSIIWIAETARVVKSADGDVLRYEGTVVDITERKQLEDWRRQKEAADAANDAKSSLLARVSHEIRTPLNGVIGMLEVLGGTPLSPKQQQQVRIARTSATSLLGLINDLLDFSKIEAGKLELNLAAFDMRSLVEEVREAFAHVAESKGLDLECWVAGDVPTAVTGDPDRVRQILVNLVNNALKFTERGRVEVRVSSEADGLHIAVRDSGIGIPESRLGRLFHDFMQVDATTTRKYGGTGLGLAICRQLAELMSGEISVRSQLGVGSEFHVRLPLSAAAIHEQLESIAPLESSVVSRNLESLSTSFPEVHESTPSPVATKGRLLLAEDNEINQMVAVELLKAAGWTVDVANNGIEAIAAAQLCGYDGILMDCQMPEMDGLTAAREIRLLEAAGRLPRHTQELVPIIAFTANAAAEDQEQCLAAGMNAFAAKPLVIEQLLATIDRVVRPAAGVAGFSYAC